jgi:hypothetical protein
MTHMPRLRSVSVAAAAGLAAGCLSHQIETAPIEVKPIHVTVDVNVKVQRELEEFFDFEQQPAPAPAPADPDRGKEQRPPDKE